MQDQPEGVSSAAPVDETPRASSSNDPGFTVVTDGVNSMEETRQNGHITSEGNPVPDGEGPRGVKRKLSTPAKGDAAKEKKAPSPPWAAFEPMNPTAFNENGVRKSGRTNALPLDLQPQGATRGRRTAYLQSHIGKSDANPQPHAAKRKYVRRSAGTLSSPRSIPVSSPSQTRTHPHPPKKARHSFSQPESKVQRQSNGHASAELQSPKKIRRSRWRSLEGTEARSATQRTRADAQVAGSTEPRTLRLNFRRATPPPLHPGSVVPTKKYGSLEECFQQNPTLMEDNERPYTAEQVRREALLRQRLEKAAGQGGVLQGDAWLTGDISTQLEPEASKTAQDYLNQHVKMFVRALNVEQAHHRREAKHLALAALEAWRKRQPKAPQSAEERLQAEWNARLAKYRFTLREMQSQWNGALAYAKEKKKREYDEEQQRRLNQNLQNLVQSQTDATARRKWRRSSASAEERSTGYNSEDQDDNNLRLSNGTKGSDDSTADDDDDDDEDDTSSSEGDGSSIAEEDPYANLEGDELRRRVYADLQRAALASETGQDSDGNEGDHLQESNLTPNYENRNDSLLASLYPEPVDRSDGDIMMLDAEAETYDLQASVRSDGETKHPSILRAGVSDGNSLLSSTGPAALHLEDVDDVMLDDEDAESSSDDETDESNDGEGEGSDEESADPGEIEDEEEEEEDVGLMGFFSRKVRTDLQAKPAHLEIHDSPVEDAETGSVEGSLSESDGTASSDGQGIGQHSMQTHPSATLNDPSSITRSGNVERTGQSELTSLSEETSCQDTSGHDTPATTIDSKPSDLEKSPQYGPTEDDTTVEELPDRQQYQTVVSPLLRGTLREYQHHGLDWLAGMYDSETNGILADEMGLGKTIQTIALLAHLATEKEIWGPHLVVVPTSVMLNWEMEFKKFLPGFRILTYYGNQEERKEKRRGWYDDDKWNVCITSYQLALQDAASLKRRNWHFLVLDEAHNIKNFKSQRWQTLLTFKSQARLLLTGTPLQNNLGELWSLLAFLAPELDESGESKFKDLKIFASMFRRPVEQILDNGREALDPQSREIITKLHHVLRPHLLRRLKADVEKQMPKKYEHVVKCRLSKRQRQLYDGYMGLAGTRDSFASGHYLSIINCLMQLRKVCNHPDLFETRQIVTSYAMPKSAIADFEIKELLVRRRLIDEERSDLRQSELLHLWRSNTPSLHERRVQQLAAQVPLAMAYHALQSKLGDDAVADNNSSIPLSLKALDRGFQISRAETLIRQHNQNKARVGFQPAYPIGLLNQWNFEKPPHLPNSSPKRCARLTEWHLNTSSVLKELFTLRPAESVMTGIAVRKFGCVTPAVVAPGMTRHALTDTGVEVVERIRPIQALNPFHESQTRLSIAFPDKSLIQYDCGKLQQLDKLLRQLQAGGHRALIFTQMTKVLDILEQFLNLHGHRYLRLDGSTKIESRQALTEQFNTDPRILAFILSSRSGGLGINLTGADTVIFYDLDWNPAMDKQCQDRCHRIGQTRDVHIYRFVSEGTIEANILRKSNQKRMLDDVVIQEGEFTTDAFYRSDEGQELHTEADAALDKVFRSSSGGLQAQDETALEQAEEKEDIDAARQAQKEYVHTDDVDFNEKSTPVAATPDAKYESPRPTEEIDTATDGDEAAEAMHPDGDRTIQGIDQYLIEHMTWELRDAMFVPMSDKQRKRAKKGKDAASIRIRR